ncbi:uncharacterized protein At4g00950 isoform X2 [Olea europaea var. sylvestris]|uniref:Uncharacterized protein n=1 Tax=Olea europaea subsp. europaea TaxID=158383 RepID=A0A8S0RP54_OLEEU|nr:uncharacterized protein At4g00950 isoform X2 [Olea europaea var. sylvestris]CAA2981680.1 Hypothetical predicted protein [Olea europaea subsp. europaea]
MGLEVEDHYEPSSTPKLYLYKLPCKPRQPQEMVTPPLQTSVSVPFQWEEAPGKPRATAALSEQAITTTPPPAKYKSARCLDLPPRLLTINHDTGKSTVLPSPTTVLDGPYVDQTVSNTCSFSFRREPLVGLEEGIFGGVKSKSRKEKTKFGSWRWGSSTENEKPVRGSFDFSNSLRDVPANDKNVKITRISKKSRSFFNFSSRNSNSWADIFSSFKLASPWRCKQEKTNLS